MWGTTRPESFPRMWDQLLVRSVIDLRCRIIPTYVGSTTRAASRPSPSSNHSHVCGINHETYSCSTFYTESFPRMWDQRKKPPDFLARFRIIPTYVGSTAAFEGITPLFANPSHVCGINEVEEEFNWIKSESFPRMWDQLSSLAALTD